MNDTQGDRHGAANHSGRSFPMRWENPITDRWLRGDEAPSIPCESRDYCAAHSSSGTDASRKPTRQIHVENRSHGKVELSSSHLNNEYRCFASRGNILK
jgi:hypothetical protein